LSSAAVRAVTAAELRRLAERFTKSTTPKAGGDAAG
jgi:hypothetical protein